MRIIFLDTETTGNGAEDRLVQLAMKERSSKPGAGGAFTHNALYKPPIPIPIEATVIHHITEKMVAERPAFRDAAEYAEVKRLLESPETITVAHNAAFDVAILSREGVVPARAICTYKVANALDPDDRIPNYRLQYLRYFLDLAVEATAHDAWGDVLVLEALFERLMRSMLERQGSEAAAFREMEAVSARPLLFSTLRFGKYNGRRLEDIARSDPEYLAWLLREKRQNPELEADWIYTLEHFLGRGRA